MNLELINLKVIDSLETEEATKMGLILPFLSQLGYNVFDVEEVIPEFTADIAKKKGEKIDYAIKMEGKICFVIEAKHVNENLDKHSKQLARYYVNTEAKIGILTNGIEYRFYTDIAKDNVMDEEPFFTFNLLNYKSKDFEFLKSFSKSNFDEYKLYGQAEESKRVLELISALDSELNDPSEAFKKIIIDKCYAGVKTKSVMDEYSEYLNVAITKYIDLKTAHKLESILPNDTIVNLDIESKKPKNTDPKTTENEFIIFGFIKFMLEEFNVELTYKDNNSYFNILLDGKINKWICRVYDNKKLKVIVPTNGDDIELLLDSPIDIMEHKDVICQSLLFRQS